MSEMVKCPNCDGKGENFFMASGVGPNGKRVHRQGMAPCSLCKGDREITRDLAARIEAGRQLRSDRLCRRISLNEEAARRGLDPRALSDMEHGRNV